MLVVVGNAIGEGKAVVRGDEIDARPWLAAAMVEFIRRGAKTGRERLGVGFAAPEIAHRVAKRIIPLGPTRRKSADLIAAGTAIPRLCDEFDARQYRVLSHRLQKAALGVEAVWF